MKITIGRKIAFPFFVMFILIVGVVGITYQGFKKVTASLDNIELETVKRGSAGNLRFNITQLLMLSHDYIITQRQYYLREFDLRNLVVDKYLYKFKGLSLTDKEQQLIELIKQDLDSIRTYSAQIFSIPNPRQSPKAWALMETIDYGFGEEVNKKTTQIFDGISKRVEEYRIQAAVVKENAMKLIFGGTFLGIFISLVVSFLTVRRISKPIVMVAKAADSIANDDYSHLPVVKTSDEVALLAKSLNTMAESIQKSQKALKESKRLTEAIVSTVPIGLFVFDANGKILSVNNAFYKNFELDQNLLLGQNIIPMFEKLNAPEECRNHILSHKPMSNIECNYSDPVKGARIINLTLCPIPLTEGESLLIIEDITKRKHDEQIVINSEKHFRALIENSSDGLCVISPDGYLLYESPSNKSITGYEYNELINQNILTLFHSDDLPAIDDLLVSLLEQPLKMVSAEMRFLHKDGRWLWIETKWKNALNEPAIGGIIVNCHDITERKWAEEALAEREKRYRALFNLSPSGIVLEDIEGNIFEVNEAYCKSIGYSKEELIGRNVRMVASPEQIPHIEDHIALLRSGKTLQHVIENIKKDGTRCWVELRETLILLPDGREGFLVIANDISERKRVEEELLKIGTAIEQTADCVVITDRNGIIQYINRAFTKIFGYSNEEVIGKTPRILKSGLHPPEFYKELWKTILSGEVFSETYINKRKDGELIYEIKTITPIKDKEGNITYFVSTAKEITEQLLAQKALKKSEELMRVALKNSPIVVYNQDMELRYTWIYNPHPTFTVEQILGKTDFDLLTAKDAAKTTAIKRQVLETGVSSRQEIKITIEGGEFYYDLTVEPLIDEDDTIIGVTAAAMEITERMRAEEEIRKLNSELEQRVIERTSQLEAVNKELEAFAYSISHDLRAPLRAIDGFSKIIIEDYETKLDDEGKRLLKIIRTNTQKMDQLITDLLSLSRVSRIEINFSSIDMTTLVNSIYHEITSPDVRKKFIFTVAKLPDTFGDTTLMRQVWSNLLSNAVKFTLPRNNRKIEIGCYQEKGNNIYFVKDSGVGLDPNYIHKLFGLFQRLHKADEFEGNGIGLAIVQRIIHRHGGEVWAEGKINEGATFYFSLPNSKSQISKGV